MSKRIYVHEVVTRDGFQMEDSFIPTDGKISLINRLSETGLAKIEVTSFVSPKAVPNLSDAQEVMQGITRQSNLVYTVLVPNVKGAERALTCSPDEMNLVMSASETHNLANVRQTLSQSLDNFAQIVQMAKGEKVRVNGTIATTFGCPFEGEVQPAKIFNIIEQYLSLGCDLLTLADTTGMANPVQVQKLIEEVRMKFPEVEITLHFHNTRGMGLANVVAGIQSGIDKFDASLGGLGGCPFAPGATGNICTEDLVHMLQFMGYDTGVNLDQLLGVARNLPTVVGHDIPGQVVKSGKITDLHDTPKNI